MTGCELIKCGFYKDGKCTDEAEYVNRYTGELMCRFNPDAIPKEEGDGSDINLRNAASDMYKALKAILTGVSGAYNPKRCTVNKSAIDAVRKALAKAEGKEVEQVG